MELLQSWKDSLALFLPRNLKQFLLITLNSFAQMGKTWLYHFWWLLLIYLPIYAVLRGSRALLLAHPYFFIPEAFPLLSAAQWSLEALLWSTILLTVRPSIMKKTWAYYFSYTTKLILSVVFIILFYLITILINNYIPAKILIISLLLLLPLLPFSLTIYTTEILIPFLSIVFMYDYLRFYPAFMIFFILFLFDSLGRRNNIFSALRRALVMVLYNYPFLLAELFIVLTVAMGIILDIYWPLSFLSGYPLWVVNIVDVTVDLIVTLFSAFHICLLTNFYTKQVHEKPEWYV